MSKLVAGLLLSFLAVAPTGVFDRPSDGLKCPRRGWVGEDMPHSIVLLDHEVHDGEPEEFTEWFRNASGRIYSLEIVCWRWVEENYGIQVQAGASHILSKEWVERTRKDRIAALDALVAAQDRHLERTGEYAGSVQDLTGFGALSDYGLPAHLLVDLGATGGAWTARLTAKESWLRGTYTRMKPQYDCFAFAGEPPVEWEAIAAEEGVELAERKPVCFPLDPHGVVIHRRSAARGQDSRVPSRGRAGA